MFALPGLDPLPIPRVRSKKMFGKGGSVNCWVDLQCVGRACTLLKTTLFLLHRLFIYFPFFYVYTLFCYIIANRLSTDIRFMRASAPNPTSEMLNVLSAQLAALRGARTSTNK